MPFCLQIRTLPPQNDRGWLLLLDFDIIKIIMGVVFILLCLLKNSQKYGIMIKELRTGGTRERIVSASQNIVCSRSEFT